MQATKSRSSDVKLVPLRGAFEPQMQTWPSAAIGSTLRGPSVTPRSTTTDIKNLGIQKRINSIYEDLKAQLKDIQNGADLSIDRIGKINSASVALHLYADNMSSAMPRFKESMDATKSNSNAIVDNIIKLAEARGTSVKGEYVKINPSFTVIEAKYAKSQSQDGRRVVEEKPEVKREVNEALEEWKIRDPKTPTTHDFNLANSMERGVRNFISELGQKYTFDKERIPGKEESKTAEYLKLYHIMLIQLKIHAQGETYSHTKPSSAPQQPSPGAMIIKPPAPSEEKQNEQKKVQYVGNEEKDGKPGTAGIASASPMLIAQGKDLGGDPERAQVKPMPIDVSSKKEVESAADIKATTKKGLHFGAIESTDEAVTPYVSKHLVATSLRASSTPGKIGRHFKPFVLPVADDAAAYKSNHAKQITAPVSVSEIKDVGPNRKKVTRPEPIPTIKIIDESLRLKPASDPEVGKVSIRARLSPFKERLISALATYGASKTNGIIEFTETHLSQESDRVNGSHVDDGIANQHDYLSKSSVNGGRHFKHASNIQNAEKPSDSLHYLHKINVLHKARELFRREKIPEVAGPVVLIFKPTQKAPMETEVLKP